MGRSNGSWPMSGRIEMPSSFVTPLDVEFLDGKTWRLAAPFEFMSEVTESVIDIPDGFLTDFASIPRVLWAALPPTGPYGKAAVVHDYLYQTMDATTHLVTRKEADQVLKEGMEVLGIGRVTRFAIYAGVRLGGWAAWNKHRKSDESSDQPPRFV